MTLLCSSKSYMTSQATNRREGVSKSCRGHSRKLRAFTQKELEIEKAVQELLGAPTIGAGSEQPGSGGGGSQRSQISLPSCPECTKMAPKWAVSCTFSPKNRQKRHFLPKSTKQNILLRCSLLKALWSYTCSKFRKS